MIDIYLANNKERKLLHTVNNSKEAFQFINSYLDINNIESYYTRMWSLKPEENGFRVDYGSP